MSKPIGASPGVQSIAGLFPDFERRARLAEVAAAIHAEDARSAGEISFNTRLLTQTTLPHSDPGDDVREYQRQNGSARLYIQAGPGVGLPFGSYPRLILSWISTEAKRLNSRHLTLGSSLGAFMGALGVATTGGATGTIPRFRDQMRRLLAARIVSVWEQGDSEVRLNTNIADRSWLWWSPNTSGGGLNWRSQLVLSEPFFEELCEHSFPLDMRVLREIRQSPLAVDLYSWLAWRTPQLTGPLWLRWADVQAQFGAEYGQTKHFTAEAKGHLRTIKAVWPQLRYETPRGRLVLHPTQPHVSPRIGRTFLAGNG